MSDTVGEKCRTSLKESGRELKCIKRNLVDAVWLNPPPPPCAPMRAHPLEFAGKSSTEKLSDLKCSLRSQNAHVQLVCTLDEVAWILNVRGSDIPCTPVTFAYLLVVAEDNSGDDGASGCTFFVDEIKLTDEVKQHLPPGLSIQPYSQTLDVFEEVVKMLECPPPSDAKTTITETPAVCGGGGVLVDRSQLSLAMADVVPEDKRVYASSPITLMKAIKNESEINGIRNCHVRDGAALTAFLAWLEEAVHLSISEGGESLTEYTICEKLDSYRSAQPRHVGPSFPTISGFGPNSAVMHYRATAEVGIIHFLLLETATAVAVAANHLVHHPLLQLLLLCPTFTHSLLFYIEQTCHCSVVYFFFTFLLSPFCQSSPL